MEGFMRTKGIALVVTLLAVAACGGMLESPPPSGGPGDGGGTSAADPPVRPPRIVDPPADPDEPSSNGLCPMTVVITAADIGLTWVAPGPSQAVCNQQNLDDLKALLAAGNGVAKYADIESALGPTCGACVFTGRSDARWGMIIKDGANVIADNSQGACFGVLETAQCGKARFEIDACLSIACPPSDCGTDTSACNQKALKGACRAFVSPYFNACKDEQRLTGTCTSFVRIVEVTCGGGPDAGLDSGL
jgi:hypothetical protein